MPSSFLSHRCLPCPQTKCSTSNAFWTTQSRLKSSTCTRCCCLVVSAYLLSLTRVFAAVVLAQHRMELDLTQLANGEFEMRFQLISRHHNHSHSPWDNDPCLPVECCHFLCCHSLGHSPQPCLFFNRWNETWTALSGEVRAPEFVSVSVGMPPRVLRLLHRES